MNNQTLNRKILDAELIAQPIRLRGLVAPSDLWEFSDAWRHLETDRFPEASLVSANQKESIRSQASVTIASAWTLKGVFDPTILLADISDPPLIGAELKSSVIDGPFTKWYGASATSVVKYAFDALSLYSTTQYDIIVGSHRTRSTIGVLLQRTYHSPFVGGSLKIRPLSESICSILLSDSDTGEEN